MRYCTVKGCENKHHGRGLCKYHYNNSRHNIDLQLLMSPIIKYPDNIKCKVAGCSRIAKHKRLSLCDNHRRKYFVSPEYKAWQSMKARCYNQNYTRYKNWGGRGIRVCDEWLDNYDVFFECVGKKPSPQHSLDRIDDMGNYEPKNVKWSTAKEQANNRRNNIILNQKSLSA